jgi:hypothetical protein
LLDGGVKGRMSDHDEGGGRNDLLDVRVLRVPSLHFIFGRLPSVHTRIESQRLDDERCGLWRDAKAPLLAGFHAPDEIENVGAEGDIVLILFFGTRGGRGMEIIFLLRA